MGLEGEKVDFYISILIKLLLATVLGALIGFERESKKRPAGLRTNILVCLGAALVQIINTDIFIKYKGMANIDPARFGAQVISGIGFLGAGTIMREGVTVKGLTTAASLWVVACIGIAIGNGSYAAAILTSIFAYLTLTMLKEVEDRVNKKKLYFEIEVKMDNKPGQLGKIAQLIGEMNVNISNVEFKEYGDMFLIIFLSLKMPENLERQAIITAIMGQEGVYSVEEI